MLALLGIIGALLGMLGFTFLKKKSAEALLQNNEVKSKLNEQDKNKAQNDGLLAAEDQKRADAQKDTDARKNEPVKPTDF